MNEFTKQCSRSYYLQKHMEIRSILLALFGKSESPSSDDPLRTEIAGTHIM